MIIEQERCLQHVTEERDNSRISGEIMAHTMSELIEITCRIRVFLY